MNWRQFIAAIISSLAWPATLVVAILILKNQLPAIFPFIERLKYKGIELEFRKSVQELTEKSRGALPAPELGEFANDRNQLYTLAELSPRSAILEAWLQVETAAAEALQSRDPSLASQVRMAAPLRIGELLNRRQIINAQQLEIFHRLRALRNQAVHISGATFQLNEVIEYIDLALSLASQIRKGT